MSGEPPRPRPRITILIKLLVAFTVPTAGLFALFAVLAYEVARRDLEAELGTRLTAVAASAATQIRGKYLTDLVPGDEAELFYLSAQRKLRQVQEATGVARLYVFGRDFSSRVDTEPGTAIGDTHFQARLDEVELDRVFDRGERISSVLFRGRDNAFYKAGYAPVFDDPDKNETVVLAVGVDAPATFFSRLEDLRENLILYGAVLALAMGIVAVLVATLFTRPIRRLAEAAERIGRGELGAAIQAPVSRDEIGLLALTMERMRADLQARDEHLQLMLAGIAHEVRNPLGGMELFTGLLRDEIDKDDPRAGHVKRIDRELNYLKRVVNDFLEYARRPAPELHDIDVSALVAEVCELERGEAEVVGVELTASCQPARARADEGQLRRVLLNLLRNAVQAASSAGAADADKPGRKWIKVAVICDREMARITVHNSGDPIPAEALPRIFEPFFTTREKGTGLGLAFAREIMADHGGAIEVQSGSDGTVFTLLLPL